MQKSINFRIDIIFLYVYIAKIGYKYNFFKQKSPVFGITKQLAPSSVVVAITQTKNVRKPKQLLSFHNFGTRGFVLELFNFNKILANIWKTK